MLEEWVDELVPAMLSDEMHREIATEIGMSNFLKLSQLVGGGDFYVPRQESILRPLRNQKIQEEFNGCNTKELARKYGVSQRWVYQIVKRSAKKRT